VNNTVRKYPRTLAEAYPRDYANPIEGPTEMYDVTNAGHRLVLAASLVGAFWLIAALLAGWLQ
jgi:hypothetical protein